MTDYIIMFGITVFLGAMMLCNAKMMPEGNEGFFDKNNTKAMRGFWCLIVILVHIPMAYQNPIQDMIASFGYVAVTFYFMTSAYGLSLWIKRNPEIIRNRFWRIRLPKLIVFVVAANIVEMVGYCIIGKPNFNVEYLLSISDWKWVQLLIFCYMILWMCYLLWPCGRKWMVATCTIISVCSVVLYLAAVKGIIYYIWPTELMGFVWGVLLSEYAGRFVSFSKNHWFMKMTLWVIGALAAGMAYRKYKHVFFVGGYLLKVILGIIILGLVLLTNTKIKLGNRVNLFLGEISYEVFLLHSFIFDLLQIVLPGLPSGVFILLSMMLTIMMAAIAHAIGSELIKRLYKLPYFRE